MNFVAIVTVSDEGGPQLEACLKSIREFYPDINIKVISDGIKYQEYKDISNKYNCDYEPGRFLKRIETGGLWWARFLSAGLSYGKEWIVKVDPDAVMHRAVRVEPYVKGVAGTLQNKGGSNEHIQGGCQAIHATAARRILQSKILESEELLWPRNYCPNMDYLRTWIPTGYFTTDHSLMFMARKLNIKWADWPEVGSRWKEPPRNENLRYAVTHPHKIKNPRHIDQNSLLHVITTCKGRLHHIKRTLPRFLDDPNVRVTVVDYGCPHKVSDWCRKNYPHVRTVRVDHDGFHLARARNLGAVGAEGEWFCFFDADLLMDKGWAAATRKMLRSNHYHITNYLQWSMTGSCIVPAAAYRKTGGYDETFNGWAPEDIDFYSMLRHVGCHPAFWPGQYAHPIAHGDDERTKFYDKGKRESKRLFDEYHKLKIRWTVKHDRLPREPEKKKLLEQAREIVKSKKDDNFNIGYQDEKPSVSVLLSTRRQPAMPKVAPRPAMPQIIPIAVSKVAPAPKIIPAFEGIAGKLPLVPKAAPALEEYPTIVPNPKEVVPMRNICVVNNATLDLGVSLDELCRVGNLYLAELGKWWGGKQATLIPSKVLLPRTRAVILMNNSDQANALGYHDLTPDGYPLSKVFVRDALVSGDPVSEVLTHELAEMQCDPFLNLLAEDLMGTFWAMEVCDPTEGQMFRLEGLACANFVTQAWFEPEHKSGSTKFDYLGLMKNPFEVGSQGYAIVYKGGRWQAVYGSVGIKSDIVKRNLWAKDPRIPIRVKKHNNPKRLAHSSYLAAAGKVQRYHH